MTSSWSNEKTIDFIDEVHVHPELWNVETGIYKDRNAKKDGWAAIANKFEISTDEACKKFRSLRTYARNEDRKKKSGSGGGKAVKWFAFDAISFVISQDTPNQGLDSQNSTNVTEIQETFPDDEAVDLADTADSQIVSPVSPVSTKQPSKKGKFTDPVLEKAKNILLQAEDPNKNEMNVFGQHIANKLTKYNPVIRAQAELKINQILFDCNMKMLEGSSREELFNRQSRNQSISQYLEMSPPRAPSPSTEEEVFTYVPQNYTDHNYNRPYKK